MYIADPFGILRGYSTFFILRFSIIEYLCRRIPGHSSFPLCTVPRQCAVLCGVYTRMWCPLCLFMYGPCAGVLPPYKFTAFQAVNMYGGSALAYVPCTGIYILYKSRAGFIQANIIMARPSADWLKTGPPYRTMV